MIGCKENLDITPLSSSQESKIKISQHSFKDLEKIPTFQEAFKQIDSKRASELNIKNKSGMEAMYNFTIDSSKVNEIRTENAISYTLKIDRDYDTSGYFENLIIRSDSLDQITAYIIRYTPNSEGVEINTEHNSFNFEGERSIQKIIYDTSIAYKVTINYYKVVTTWCSTDYDHIAYNTCF